MNISLLLTCIFLSVLSVSDVKTKTVPAWASPAFLLLSGVLHLFLKDRSAAAFFAGLLPGVVLLVLSLVFRASVGCGDGFAAMACGAALGPERIMAALAAAFVFCAVFCMVLLLLKRIRRSDSLPFLPFLASSHIVMLIAEVIL